MSLGSVLFKPLFLNQVLNEIHYDFLCYYSATSENILLFAVSIFHSDHLILYLYVCVSQAQKEPSASSADVDILRICMVVKKSLSYSLRNDPV